MNPPPNTNFKDPQPRSPAPSVDPVFVWPTPEERDFLFYVEKNGDMPANKKYEYGQPYPDKLNYPNHKLVYVSPQTDDKWSRWYYASERILQDEYNWNLTVADIAGTKFDVVRRAYLFLRSEHDAVTPLMGSAMPNIPRGKFNTEFVLAERKQIDSPEIELNALFIFEERFYVKRCSITTIQTEDFFGIGGSKVDNWYYRGEVVDGLPVEDHFASPNSSYWGWQADGTQRDGRQISENWFIISIISSITDVIDDYEFSFPSFTSINFPRELSDAQLTFNVNKSEGNMDNEGYTVCSGDSISVSIGLSDSTSSSISISPELGLSFRERNGSYVPCMVYAFFLPEPCTLAAIISRVTALHGSAVTLYRPPDTASALVTLVSAAASVRANASAAFNQSIRGSRSDGGESYNEGKERSVSIDKSVSQTTQFLQINGIAGGISIPTGEQTDEVSATAAMNLFGTGVSSGMSVSAFITDSAEVTASAQVGSVAGDLNPGSSDGSFITRISVDPYRFERAKVYVEVIDLPLA